MTDLGVLRLPPDADLSAFEESEDGYSSVHRGGTMLYPVKNEEGRVYFSRSPLGDGSPGNTSIRVARKSD